LQPPKSVVQIGTAPEEILAAGGQDEIVRQCAAGLHRGFDALDRQAHVENRIIPPAAMILDGTAGETGLGRRADRLGDAFRAVSKALFEIGRNRQRRGCYDGPTVIQGGIPANSTVRDPQGEGQAGARGGEGPKAHGGQNSRRAGIPWIGNDERACFRMQRAKRSTFFAHPVPPPSSRRAALRPGQQRICRGEPGPAHLGA
jgi:hypothetical protein